MEFEADMDAYLTIAAVVALVGKTHREISLPRHSEEAAAHDQAVLRTEGPILRERDVILPNGNRWSHV